MQKAEQSNRVAIITVHGTGDGADADQGDKWWQLGSTFLGRLQDRLRQSGHDPEFICLHWSGANNMLERERAAYRLAAMIRETARRYRGVHVIGHSHGGTVANDAAIELGWGSRRGRKTEAIHSLVTVGTPYLYNQVSQFRFWATYAFFALALLSTVILGLVLLSSFAYLLFNFLLQGDQSGMVWLRFGLVVLSIPVVAVILYFMIKEAMQGRRRVLRSQGHYRARTTIFTIWHPHDEAISALSGVGRLRFEPFGPGALLRGSSRPAVFLAVNLVVLSVLAALGVLTASGLGWVDFGALVPGGIPNPSSLTDYVILTALILVSPIAVWAGTYLIYRLVAGVIPELAFRTAINGQISGVFRSMAYGSVGDLRPEDVSHRSHAFRSHEMKIEGELADRMKANAAKAADALLAKYRWTIFDTAADHARVVQQIYKDAATWDSLIHTTYFEQPEIVEMIADHIAEAASAPQAARR